MNYVLPVTHVRKNLLHLVDTIDEEYTRVDITKNGTVKATMVSPDYLDELEETIYTMTNSMDDIRKAEKDITNGKYITLNEYLKESHAGKTASHSRKNQKNHR